MLKSEEFCSYLEDHYNSELPFVVYRKPESVEVEAYLQKDDKLNRIRDFNESGFVFAPFDAIEDAILFPFSNCKIISSSSVNFKCISYPVSEQSEIYQPSEKENHIKLVTKGLKAIQAEDFKKVVLSRFEIVKLKESNPLAVLGELLKSYKNAFVYCWYHPKIGVWLGATPETLLKVDGIRFETTSLAGTQLYNGTTEIDWQEKEKEEQQIVTDFITQSIQPLTDIVKVSKAKTYRAGNVLHLLTNISGALKLDQFNLKKFIKVIHPTPAICGLPRESAKKFIIENENYNREFYTGFLGILNENNGTELYINLRCMQLKNKEAIIYIGGGITKDSIPESEWEETVNKSNTIKKVLLYR